MNNAPDFDFDIWHDRLQELAARYQINVSDTDAWHENWERGDDPLSALAEEYPEILEDTASVTARHIEKLDVERVAAVIGHPVDTWPGNCYGIACNMVETGLVKGRAVYGHYLGSVAPGTLFSGRPMIRHGWIESDDGRIVDPTRWVFDGTAPAIHETESPSSEYDECGDAFRFLQEEPPPEHEIGAPLKAIPDQACHIFSSLLGRNDVSSGITAKEAFWLANLSLSTLGDSAAPLYQALRDMEFGSLIPIDNDRKVMG